MLMGLVTHYCRTLQLSGNSSDGVRGVLNNLSIINHTLRERSKHSQGKERYRHDGVKLDL